MKKKQQCEVFVTRGREFAFNDHVCMEMLRVPDEKRTGRLVQVRKGCGQFESDVYIVRLRDGSLSTFENVLMRPADDPQSEDAFYRSIGMTPPVIPPQPPHALDTVGVEYTIKHKYPETGFIVEHPSQPETPGLLAAAITSNDEVSL